LIQMLSLDTPLRWWRDPATEGRFAACKGRMARVKDVFDAVDADGGGALDREEIRVLCEKLLQLTLTEPQLDDGMAEMDADGGGEVSFQEFYTWWDQCQDGVLGEAKKVIEGNTLRAGIREYFEKVDADGSGTLDREEIRALCQDMLKMDITEEQLDQGLAERGRRGRYRRVLSVVGGC
jgi:Ca2+-binding EF-hand superfamily protein